MNTGFVVLALTALFLAFSIILLTGRLDLLPFQDQLWQQFIAFVPPQKQSETGLSLLGITVSGASAAALYLVSIGTSRWSMNRRIGYIHLHYGREIAMACGCADATYLDLRHIVEAFVDGSQNVFDQVSDTHPSAQIYFERARMNAHMFLTDGLSGNLDAIGIATDLFRAALVCRKSIPIPNQIEALSAKIATGSDLFAVGSM
jgi:hypothetical protein